MKKTFRVGQSVEIIKGEKLYDLHNQYDFTGFVLIANRRRLQLFFEPHPEFGKDQIPVSLIFEELDHLEFSPNFGCRLISDLDEIGYKNPEDHDLEWLMDEKQADQNDHLIFRMGHDDFVRVHCKSADIVEKSKLPVSS